MTSKRRRQSTQQRDSLPKKPERKMTRFIVRALSAVTLIAFFWMLLHNPFYLPYVLLLITFCTYYEILCIGSIAIRNRYRLSMGLFLPTAWIFYFCLVTSFFNLPAFLGKLIDRLGPRLAAYVSRLSPAFGTLTFTVLQSVQRSFPILFNEVYSFSLGTFLLLICLLRTKAPIEAMLAFCGWMISGLFLTIFGLQIVIISQKDHMYFFLPAALVVVNDSFAYICGVLLGRHPLTRLSPSKTWEGYIGGGIMTLVVAHFFAVPLIERFGGSSLRSKIDADAAIRAAMLAAAATKAADSGSLAFRYSQLGYTYICSMLLALWVSIVGPVGGLLASLTKRYTGIKNFSNIIPGHGGVIDRIDCHILAIIYCNMLYNFYE